MKILRISSRKAEYSTNGKTYQSISDINKDDILKLLNIIMQSDAVMDSKISDISNEAEKIIYSKLKEKLDAFHEKKDETKQKVDSIFSEANSAYNIKDKD